MHLAHRSTVHRHTALEASQTSFETTRCWHTIRWTTASMTQAATVIILFQIRASQSSTPQEVWANELILLRRPAASEQQTTSHCERALRSVCGYNQEVSTNMATSSHHRDDRTLEHLSCEIPPIVDTSIFMHYDLPHTPPAHPHSIPSIISSLAMMGRR